MIKDYFLLGEANDFTYVAVNIFPTREYVEFFF